MKIIIEDLTKEDLKEIIELILKKKPDILEPYYPYNPYNPYNPSPFIIYSVRTSDD